MQVTCARNNLAKKNVWLSIETHFGIFLEICVFGIKPKYSYNGLFYIIQFLT